MNTRTNNSHPLRKLRAVTGIRPTGCIHLGNYLWLRS